MTPDASASTEDAPSALKADLVRSAFRDQAESCRTLGSPFTAALCDLAADRLTQDTAVGRHILDWIGDPSGAADSVPLRFAGALHALGLQRADHGLARVYPPVPFDAEAVWQAVEAACRVHEKAVLAHMASSPQTNEVRRSAALLPGFLTIAERFQKPLVLSEVGASAGLNLQWDTYAYRLGTLDWGPPDAALMLSPDWSGPPPPQAPLIVTERAGCDLRPIDPSHPDDALRLLSYIWADQDDRVTRTRAALSGAARSGLKVEEADAVDWLERRLMERHSGQVHVIYHSVAWQYFPKEAQARGEALIARAGFDATQDAPIARLSFEADGTGPGGGIVLEMWPPRASGSPSGGDRQTVGRADFHGRWVQWTGWRDDRVLSLR